MLFDKVSHSMPFQKELSRRPRKFVKEGTEGRNSKHTYYYPGSMSSRLAVYDTQPLLNGQTFTWDLEILLSISLAIRHAN